MSKLNMTDMNEDEATLIVKYLTGCGYVIRRSLPSDNVDTDAFPYVAGFYEENTGIGYNYASINDAAKAILFAAKNGWFEFYPDKKNDLSTRQQLWVDLLMSEIEPEYLKNKWA